MWNTPAEWHAALNDLPGALFIAAMVFQVAGRVTGRDSLKQAGFWSLIGSAVGAVFAVASGLSAEGSIEHGSAMHRSIERHQTLAIIFTIFVVSMALWRVVRVKMGPKEVKAYAALGLMAFFTVMWVGSVGGRIVFQHAGGIDTGILQSSLEERQAGHAHVAGEADHEHAPGTPAEHEHPEAGDTGADAEAAEHAH